MHFPELATLTNKTLRHTCAKLPPPAASNNNVIVRAGDSFLHRRKYATTITQKTRTYTFFLPRTHHPTSSHLSTSLICTLTMDVTPLIPDDERMLEDDGCIEETRTKVGNIYQAEPNKQAHSDKANYSFHHSSPLALSYYLLS